MGKKAHNTCKRWRKGVRLGWQAGIRINEEREPDSERARQEAADESELGLSESASESASVIAPATSLIVTAGGAGQPIPGILMPVAVTAGPSHGHPRRHRDS